MKNIIIFILFFASMNLFSQSLDDELLIAAYENNEKAIFDLLRKGADANAMTVNGETPLMYSVQNGNYLICKKLIENGADVNALPKYLYSTPMLINSMMNQDTGIVLLLLENGANPDVEYSVELVTPLLLSINRNNFFFTKALLIYGANPNKFVSDVSPLMNAISLGVDTNFINILLDFGANPNLANSLEYTPLSVAVLYENYPATKILLRRGAKPPLYDPEKSNPLDEAIEYKLDNYLDLYMPYYKENLNIYHTKALVNDYNTGAKKIRKYTGKSYLTPVFSKVILGIPIFFNHKEMFGGLKVGVLEVRYNFDLKLSVEPRFFQKAILYEYRPDYYLQLWEKRVLLTAEFDKNFVLNIPSKGSNGIYLRVKSVFSFGDYRGTNIEIPDPFLMAYGAGFWYKEGFIKINAGYMYLPFINSCPHFFTFDLNFLIPFIYE